MQRGLVSRLVLLGAAAAAPTGASSLTASAPPAAVLGALLLSSSGSRGSLGICSGEPLPAAGPVAAGLGRGCSASPFPPAQRRGLAGSARTKAQALPATSTPQGELLLAVEQQQQQQQPQLPPDAAVALQQQLDAMRRGAPAPVSPTSTSTSSGVAPPAAPRALGSPDKKTFYKRKLPTPPAIEFSSPEGATWRLGAGSGGGGGGRGGVPLLFFLGGGGVQMGLIAQRAGSIWNLLTCHTVMPFRCIRAGRLLFQEALMGGTMVGFFKLMEQFK